jgi:Zn-dependent M28 family amino/carboxypeptidase
LGFTGEETGMQGSDFYAAKLSNEQRSKIDAMVNLDTLGLGPTKVWASHSDKQLLDALARIANLLKLPIAAVNVDRVGTTDSESFAQFKIPRITIHSVTQETWPILHSKQDALTAIHPDDYYASYHFIVAYLAFLDATLGQSAAVPAQ